MPKKRIILAPLMFAIVLIASLYIHPPETVSATSGISATVDKVSGDLTFTLTAAPASSSKIPHWKTVGFYVTKKSTGRNGDSSVSASRCIFFNNLPKGCKIDETKGNGRIKTKFTIPKDEFLKLCDKAKVDYDSLTKSGGKVYLQGVLQGYKPSNKRALTERCYSLSQMKGTRRGILLHP